MAPLFRRLSSAGASSLLLAGLALLLLALPASATPAPAGVTLVQQNSSCLSFSVELPAGVSVTDSRLHVFVQPVLDGNATDAFFPLPTDSATMLVEVANLKPDSEYGFTFYLESGVNGSSPATTPNPPIVRTFRLGPQIVGFFARDPSPDSQPSEDELFSNGDTLTVSFQIDTNQPPVGSKAELDQVLKFSHPIGSVYSGEWENARTLVITVYDIGQSSPPLGELSATVVGNIASPDGLSDVSISVSPPLIGSFAAFTAANPRYFFPVDASGNLRANPDHYSGYGVASIVDKPISIPLALAFPDPPPYQIGYGLNARVSYPTDLDYTAFALVGDNFTYPGPITGTTTRMSNVALSAALRTLKLIPKPGYLGYASVQLDLINRAVNPSVLVSTAYVTILIEGEPAPLMPSISADGSKSGFINDPVGTIKSYQTPLIIALCSVVGFFVLLGLGVCLFKKYRSGRDSRDFEAQSLREEEPSVQGEGGPTRRFYYDAKV